MPELPEAEVSRRTLAPLVVGRRIVGVTVFMPSRVSRPVQDPGGFTAALRERVIVDLERRGKDLLFRLDDDGALSLNLGLWAGVTVRDHAPVKGEPARLGLSLELVATAGGEAAGPSVWLVVADVTFSRWGVGEYEPPPQPPPYDALSGEPTGALLAGLAAGPARGARTVKAFLMDARALAGIGNGYADDILWRARVHPGRPTGGLGAAEWEALAAAIRAELQRAIADGGERGYLDALGRPGRRDRPIHHHAGDPCPRCAATLEGYVKGGRETDFCPVCQPAALGF